MLFHLLKNLSTGVSEIWITLLASFSILCCKVVRQRRVDDIKSGSTSSNDNHGNIINDEENETVPGNTEDGVEHDLPIATDSSAQLASKHPGHEIKNQFCKHCQRLLKCIEMLSRERLVWSLSASCPLCQFLSANGWMFEDEILAKIDGNSEEEWSILVQDPLFFPNLGIITRKPSDYVPLPSKVQSFDWIRDTIQECASGRHDACCDDSSIGVPNPYRVIDCNLRIVVDAPEDCQYLALSYVWGKTSVLSSNISSAAQTIQDAITVTVQLGFQYLWVDQYCIDQKDERHLLIQINQMNYIYQNAVATIIDAAGSNSGLGLPGISAARYPILESESLWAEEMVNIRQPLACIIRSPWATRGWTFQEGLFSRRRIFFTNAQVVIDCKSDRKSEFASLLPLLNRPSLEVSKWSWNLPIWNGEQSIDIYKGKPSFDGLLQMIEDYSERVLGRKEDVIRAFSGVFSVCRALTDPICHIWGIPFRPFAEDARIQFLNSLLFRLQAFVDIKVDSKYRVPIRRRGGFPSWSWTGWTNKCFYDIYSDTYLSPKQCYLPIVQFELHDGQILSISDLAERLVRNDNPESITEFLWLTTWTHSAKGSWIDEALVIEGNDWDITTRPDSWNHFKESQMDVGDECEVTIAWIWYKDNPDHTLHGLLIYPVDENRWERIGRANFRSNIWDLELFDHVNEMKEFMEGFGAELKTLRLA